MTIFLFTDAKFLNPVFKRLSKNYEKTINLSAALQHSYRVQLTDEQ